ncbi:LysR family transcriptional regulator [Methylobacterium planeticum]|uniref:LysR family transcriptional regulator n=1 Tax=Methylobacterium planeticum TaxID=2615211 RepID=A0A6N6MT57_9HYPH|nr:LysR family transcriptional regulator [Methylobacterium planeticum]KAB1073460.1 LysR family transcriptional regulator [Methylobacterium planeticum]
MARPSLQALEVFLAVARLGSFRRAAATRGVTPSALSHLIRGLEEGLDVRLFHRTSRSVALTEAGRLLLERIGSPLDQVGAAIDRVGSLRDEPAGTLRINAPRIVAELVFEPIVARFLAAYPKIRLEVVTTDGLVDIVGEGFDAGIRRDRRLAPGMIAVPVGPARRFAVVAAPSYMEGREPPRTLADLQAHLCIERRFPNGSRYAWEFAKDGEAVEVEVTGPLVVDETRLMLRAALDGVGIGFMFEELVAHHLAAGRLLRFLEDWCPVAPRFHLFYSGRRQVPPPLRALIEFLKCAGPST